MTIRHLFRRSGALAAPLALAALTAACTVGPDYKRPDLQPPPAHRGQSAPAAESLADATWWQVFDDPALCRPCP